MLKYLRNAVVPDNIHLLIADSLEINGVKFYGSSYTPEFNDWAFQLYGEEGKAHWSEIPDDTDVLVTHGPALGTLDETGVIDNPGNIGCLYLRERIVELAIKAHLFGHIHGGYGKHSSDYLALNSAVLSERYKVINRPQVFEF